MTNPLNIKRLLIANRGEIAVRIARAAETLGIETVGVYAFPDNASLHVTSCSRAEPLEGDTPSQAYLDIQGILEVAERNNCDAIHPGYGFLSENPSFAAACADKGIIFVGPTADTISSMGKKIEARALMEKAQVPVIPGATLDEGVGSLETKAAEVGFPVLIKASAGGGGKGMRRVDAPEELLVA